MRNEEIRVESEKTSEEKSRKNQENIREKRNMKEFVTRNLTADECAALERTGSRAEDWSKVRVATDFNPSQVSACRFEGCVEIGSGAVLADSRVAN